MLHWIGDDRIMPGGDATIDVEMLFLIAGFAVNKDGRTVGAGVIAETNE